MARPYLRKESAILFVTFHRFMRCHITEFVALIARIVGKGERHVL
jgi:hypothetical protein